MNSFTNHTEQTQQSEPGMPSGTEDKGSPAELDEAFAAWTTRNFCHHANNAQKDTVGRIATAVSYALHLKHTCLDLASYQRLGDSVLNELLKGIGAEEFRELESAAVGDEGSYTNAAPLVRSKDGMLLWLQKYYAFELAIVNRIGKMTRQVHALTESQRQDLHTLYGQEHEDQCAAVKIALSRQFSVITGGPGTGKTYTVARIIALMLKHGLGDQAKPRIALAAPTGKAANRMDQSVISALASAEIKRIMGENERPAKASTLHSLLKIYRGSPKARHDINNPLPVDVLIVDEASMIDLPMMYRILQALPDHAHLILLGDKDQLASVEAGSVMAELCAMEKPYVAKIGKSYRYESSPEIGALAAAINKNAPLPDFDNNEHVTWHNLVPDEKTWTPEWLGEAEEQLKKLTKRIKQGTRVSKILQHQTDFQVLCALRKGPAGVAGINSMVATRLKKEVDAWYEGRPVMVLSNDHQRKLYNGDVGLVLRVREQDGDWVIEKDENKGMLRSCFPIGEQEVKAISMAQMPVFETCYAMTVHKSQGSEYEKVLFVLPAEKTEVEQNPVITRELLYTGITRARKKVEIWSGEGVIEAAVKKQTVRMSGLGKHSD